MAVPEDFDFIFTEICPVPFVKLVAMICHFSVKYFGLQSPGWPFGIYRYNVDQQKNQQEFYPFASLWRLILEMDTFPFTPRLAYTESGSLL